MSITEDIADFVASFSLNAAPAELLPRVREAFLDSFGVMLAGSREESAQIAARWVRDQGNNGKCTVLAQKNLHARLQMRRWPTASLRIRWTMIISATRAP
jgi:2-methylcitrate dehydratase PrpD